MCCEDGDACGDLPRPVRAMLEDYWSLHGQRGFDWGDELGYGRGLWLNARYAGLQELTEAHRRLTKRGLSASWDLALWTLAPVHPDLGLAELTDDGLRILRGIERTVLADGAAPCAVLIHSTAGSRTTVGIGDVETTLDPGTAVLVPVTATGALLMIAVDGSPSGVSMPGGRATVATTLILETDAPSRWSVVDDDGTAWFPETGPRKWDAHGRPFFHGRRVTLQVPAGRHRVRVARGTEFRSRELDVDVEPNAAQVVELAPERLYDAAAAGWYSADLHVHLNYVGHTVVTPEEGRRMQEGEGLHLMNLVAGNASTSLVYDRACLETYAGSTTTPSGHQTAWGVEYRNDLLGHVHATSPNRPPTYYYAGHPRSDRPHDWPPNAVVCREFRAAGATVGYAHPVSSDIDAASPEAAFRNARSTEARELVADAAIGLVDSIDLIASTPTTAGNVVLYHQLLNCGFRLAASAGTDTMLGLEKMWTLSNPPGWARVYADLGDEPFSLEAWKDALRSGHTFATNGPWLSLEVDGHGPGDVIALDAPRRIAMRATGTAHSEVTLSLVGPDRPLASRVLPEGCGVIELETTVDAPIWLAAVLSGPAGPDVLYDETFAHTTPVYLDLKQARVVRHESVRWCLNWLDLLEDLARREGNFASPAQFDDLRNTLDQARAVYRAVAHG